MEGCTVSTEYQRRGLDTVFLENEHLRIEVLAGKGGDITEFRHKRTDTNILFEVPYEWHAPDDSYVGAPDSTFAFMDHYPGGWQNIAPSAGGEATVQGASFGLHTGAALSPWEVVVESKTPDRAAIRLSLRMTRYPLELERRLILDAGEPTLTVEDSMRNNGDVEVPYTWLQHLVFGPPLLDPACSLEVPCETVIADPFHDDPNTRFEPGTEGDWPTLADADGTTVDLTSPPPKADRVHDLVALTDLRDGRYDLTNPDLDLGVEVTFPADLYEYIWYWGAFGGFEAAPFFGRNYNLGLEPCTSVPNAGLNEAIEAGTANTLAPNADETATMTVTTHPARHSND